MPRYNISILLLDTDLDFSNLDEARKAADEWAREIANREECQVIDTEVMETP